MGHRKNHAAQGRTHMFNPVMVSVANQLIEFCNKGEEAQALATLYDEGVVSIEAAAMPGMARETYGLDELRGKHDWWNNAHEVHEVKAEGPFCFGDNQFTVIFDMDATNKQSGERMQAREIALYSVLDGKIVREEFFYGA